jgi:transcription-repair coupling factor (superfamily II helicase)
VLEKLLKHESLRPLLELFNAEGKETSLLVETLWETPKALLALLIQQVTKKHVLIISGKKEDRLLDNFAFFQEEILDFLPWDTLPGEDISPNLDISGKRLEILYKISTEKKKHILHASIQSLMQKTISKKTLLPLCTHLVKGQETSFDSLPEKLTALGYIRRPVASDKGEFAVRGGLIDLFPIGATEPYRIDFFGDTIEDIRTYDPIGQRSTKKMEELFLYPASESALLKAEKKPGTLLDYLGKNTVFIFDDLLAIEDSYVRMHSLIDSKLLFSLKDLLEIAKNHSSLFFTDQKIEALSQISMKKRQGRDFYSGKNPLQPLSFEFANQSIETIKWNHPFKRPADFFSQNLEIPEDNTEELLQAIGKYKKPLDLEFIVASSSEEKMIRAKAEDLLIEFPVNTLFSQGYLSSGFILDTLAYIPTSELTHRYKIRRGKWRNIHHAPPSSFHELHPGDMVVHLQNGIGQFLGLTHKPNHLGEETEYLQIEYAENSKLYVPVSQSHLVSRYIGSGEEKPTFSTLGSNRWQKICKNAEGSIVGYAKDLLEKMAERVSSGGFCFPEDSLYMQMFEDEFPFTETEDQLKAIEAIKKDMCSPKSMDRLICGDVGYGKTEVSMRAAFKAVCDGKKQVAVLVPTTVLAMQHFETFKARMANFPVEIAVLSRFCSSKEAKEILKKTAEGKIDILIGTHRLVSKDVVFHDLGLLIIDEEQRFGVRAKEHVRALKVGVDCLTLSATPIPRTLYMSLVGVKEISEISTPPQDRLPIRSLIAEKDNSMIKNAILREFARDGQAIFVHNRVETLPKIQDELQRLVPEAKIITGHGQMGPEEIDMVFHAFKSGEADLLLATTIIENGIDIPNVNTIFIDRADQFGMADLYQLRGRVGRWNRPAYAYFLTPKNQVLPEPARKRLQALAESSGYGGGMKLALRDLEIRGAGNILGVEQSGQISAIGFHFYCRLLKKAVEALKKNQPIHFTETKMEFWLDAKIPETYVSEPSLRMELYYKLGSASSFSEIDEIGKELSDRFGPFPKAVELLLLFTRIKLHASSLLISSLKFERFTVLVEKQTGKGVVRETLKLPPLKDLTLFQEEIIKLLSNWRPLQKK